MKKLLLLFMLASASVFSQAQEVWDSWGTYDHSLKTEAAEALFKQDYERQMGSSIDRDYPGSRFKTIFQYDPLPTGGCGFSAGKCDPKQITAYYRLGCWDSQNSKTNLAFYYHEMGHNIFNYDHSTNCDVNSIMSIEYCGPDDKWTWSWETWQRAKADFWAGKAAPIKDCK